MRIGSQRGFNHFINDMFRRWLIGITHAKINNILSRRTSLGFQLVNNVKNVGG